PAITSNLLKQKSEEGDLRGGWLDRHAPWLATGAMRARDWFNRTFEAGVTRYTGTVRTVVERKWLFLVIYVATVALLAVLFLRLPTGFLPTEDQGGAQVQFRLPAGATLGRTTEVQRAVENYFAEHESSNLKTIFTVAGGGGGGVSGQNTGQGFLN